MLKHDGYRYQFSPYALIWSRDYYYVVGWSEKHGKLAQFRVDRMTAMEPSTSLPCRRRILIRRSTSKRCLGCTRMICRR